MKIKRFWAAQDLPAGIGGFMAFISMAVGTGGTVAAIGTNLVNDERWFAGNSTTHAILFNLLGLGCDFNNITVWGYRLNTDTPASVHLSSLYNGAGSAYVARSQASQAAGIVANTSVYIETALDWVNFTMKTYLNGNPTPVLTQQLTSAQMATILTTYSYATIGGWGATGTWKIKDVHVREYAPGETYVPLASPRFSKVFMAPDTQATGYTASNGATPDAVLNAVYPDITTNVAVPTLVTTDGQGPPPPITGSLLLPSRFSGNILAAEFFATNRTSEAVLGTIKASLTQGGQTLDGLAVPNTAAMSSRKYSYANALNTAPDGAAWTRAKINATKLSLRSTTT